MNGSRTLLRVALLAALACGPGRSASGQGDTEAFRTITLKQVMGRGWADFERTFAALSADPRNDEAFQELSVAVGEAGALNKVTPYLETLVAQRPQDATLRTILGRVYKDMIRDPGRARLHFEAVLERDADDFFAHYQLAQLSARQGEAGFGAAVAHYRAAAEKVTRQYADLRTRILMELGELLYSRREAAPKYVPEACAAWDATTAGVRRFDLQTYEELADEYRARALWPKVEETYERYFAALREINDVPENIVRCRLKTRMGEACENQKLYAKAIEAYAEAATLLDQNTWQRRTLEARLRACYEQLARAKDYEQALRKDLAENPDSLAAHQALARTLAAGGRDDEAAALLEAARKRAPRNVPVLTSLEALYRKAGRDEALAGVLRARIDLSPEDFNAYVELADLNVRAGRTADGEKVLAELESSPGELPEKFLLLARAYARYGLPKRAFLLYKRVADSGQAGAEERFEFCDFCLAHEAFAAEATAQAARLSDGGRLDANGFVRLAEVFARHGKNDAALGLLQRGLAAGARRPDGTENREAVFTLNAALSDLEHRMGAGHHAEAIGSTLRALLAAPDPHFKRLLNDRLVTLLANYGHRQKLLYTAEEEQSGAGLLGGTRGEGIAPWVDFLNVQANSREEADLWMLLGQIHETVEVDAELPPRTGSKDKEPRRIKTDIAQARLCYQKVIDMEFQNLDAHLAMARVLSDPAVDEYEKAVNEFEVLSLLNPVTRWESVQAIGDLYAGAGETALAAERLSRVAQESAAEPDLLAQAAMRMFRTGDLTNALDLAEQAVAISPSVFRYRVAYANLLARAAAADPGRESLIRYVDDMNEALRLAQASPALAASAPQAARRLVDGRIGLGRRCFEAGDYAVAREQFEAAAALLKSAGDSGAGAVAADTGIQAARCVEALGDRAGAARRYEEILKDRPDVRCWVSSSVTLSGRSFLALKRGGELAEGVRPPPPKPAAPIAARPLSGPDLHDAVRACLATADGRLYIEGTRERYRVDAAAGNLSAASERATPLDAGAVEILPAGDGRAVMAYADVVRALRVDSGDGIWTRSAADAQRFGRVESIRAAGQIVVVGGTRGVQVLAADTGQPLWESMGDGMTFGVDDRALALLASPAPGTKELLTFEPRTGKALAKKAVSSTALWYRPVPAGDRVLLTDSLNGTVFGLDARTGEERFTFAAGAPPIAPAAVVGDAAFVYTLREGIVRAAVLDLARLKVRFEVPLAAGGSSVEAFAASPLAWRDRLLYLDARTGAVLALDVNAGTVEAIAPADGKDTPPQARSTPFWCLAGDTLCLVGADGKVRLLQLSAAP